MTSIIKLLPSDHYIASLEHADEGAIGLTHLASLKWIDGSHDKFFVKIYPSQYPKGIINEITGYLLAHACNLPQPPKAALLQISKPILDSLHIDNDLKHGDHILAWATQDCGKTPKTIFDLEKMSELDCFRNILIEWGKINELVSFDDWVANQDRNLGNITMQSSSQFALIDHGGLPVDQNWTTKDLHVDRHYTNILLSFLWGDTPPYETALDIFDASKKHDPALHEALSELNEWWQYFLDPVESHCIEHFLTERACKSPERIKDRLDIMVAV